MSGRQGGYVSTPRGQTIPSDANCRRGLKRCPKRAVIPCHRVWSEYFWGVTASELKRDLRLSVTSPPRGIIHLEYICWVTFFLEFVVSSKIHNFFGREHNFNATKRNVRVWNIGPGGGRCKLVTIAYVDSTIKLSLEQLSDQFFPIKTCVPPKKFTNVFWGILEVLVLLFLGSRNPCSGSWNTVTNKNSSWFFIQLDHKLNG